MADLIHLLPDSIANQIAAGEVVQRPSSAVKELLENAVDAGAREISLQIKNGGKTHIRIIDDGCGMSTTDARMSLERHATSKIRKAEDLFTIKTMGFRGEAMASIAAVSQLVLKTCTRDQEVGTRIEVSASEVTLQEPVATIAGTSVTVKNLFYNIPARRNFLKSDGVETKHIVEEFQRIAMANAGIKMSMHQNDLETFNLAKGKLSQRIVNLFGSSYKEQLISCKEETSHITVHGYVGKPEFSKRSRGEQFFFVNNRFIKSGYLNHAVLNAYQGLLQPDTFPFYVLFIDIDPYHVDVNVHPTKTEIKFDDERTIYGIVNAAVRQALGMHNIVPSLDFEQDVNFGKQRQAILNRDSSMDKAYAQFQTLPRDTNLANWEQLYTEQIKQSRLNFEVGQSNDITLESAINKETGQSISEASDSLFQVHGRYILAVVKSGVLFVDQQIAHERILFEQFMDNLSSSSINSQHSLFPVTLELNPADFSLVMEMKKEMELLGFIFEEFGNNCIVINGMPAGIEGTGEKQLFEGLIEQFKLNKNELTLSTQENLARSLAKRSALTSGKRLNQEEMSSLIDGLFGCKNSNYAPDGRLTFFILDLKNIDNFFNR